MLLCHFLAYSSKLYIEEEKLTPFFQIEPPTSRLASPSGLFTNFWPVTHRSVGLQMFSDNPILVFLTVLLKKPKFSLFLAFLKRSSVSMENKMYLWQLSSYKTDSKWGNFYPMPKESTSGESGWERSFSKQINKLSKWIFKTGLLEKQLFSLVCNFDLDSFYPFYYSSHKQVANSLSQVTVPWRRQQF